MHALESGKGELTHWSQVDETSSRPVSRSSTCAKIQEQNDQINVNGYPYLSAACAWQAGQEHHNIKLREDGWRSGKNSPPAHKHR